mgnify:CR=1 FL=1
MKSWGIERLEVSYDGVMRDKESENDEDDYEYDHERENEKNKDEEDCTDQVNWGINEEEIKEQIVSSERSDFDENFDGF